MDPAARPTFRPLVIGALYPSIERSLSADLLAARALGGIGYPVCTTHVVAGHGRVTDVLEVPTDSVSAQLEHVFATTEPTGAKVGIAGHPATIETIFRLLRDHLDGPHVLDLTLSGPSGEDLIGTRGLDALRAHLAAPDLVTMRRVDAERVTGMEIPSLDDAQVAVQRIAAAGARRVLLRLGKIATHYFDLESPAPDFAVDLYHDGDEFLLFEAPYLERPSLHGASSALCLSCLKHLVQGVPMPEAIQQAKAYVTEALKHSQGRENRTAPHYFWETDAHGHPQHS